MPGNNSNQGQVLYVPDVRSLSAVVEVLQLCQVLEEEATILGELLFISVDAII